MVDPDAWPAHVGGSKRSVTNITPPRRPGARSLRAGGDGSDVEVVGGLVQLAASSGALATARRQCYGSASCRRRAGGESVSAGSSNCSSNWPTRRSRFQPCTADAAPARRPGRRCPHRRRMGCGISASSEPTSPRPLATTSNTLPGDPCGTSCVSRATRRPRCKVQFRRRRRDLAGDAGAGRLVCAVAPHHAHALIGSRAKSTACSRAWSAHTEVIGLQGSGNADFGRTARRGASIGAAAARTSLQLSAWGRGWLASAAQAMARAGRLCARPRRRCRCPAPPRNAALLPACPPRPVAASRRRHRAAPSDPRACAAYRPLTGSLSLLRLRLSRLSCVASRPNWMLPAGQMPAVVPGF